MHGTDVVHCLMPVSPTPLMSLISQAIASEGATDDAKRRGDAFSQAFRSHLSRFV